MADVDGYAAAIFEIAQAEGTLGRVEDELYALARAVETSEELRDTLADPRIPVERKQAVVQDLIGTHASEPTVAFVGLVVGLGRAADLPEIADRLVARAAASRDRAVAEVRSAIPLDDDTIDRLAKALSKATGSRVEVRAVVDPSVLGGIVAQVGDTVIDGSVRRRLESLRETLGAR